MSDHPDPKLKWKHMRRMAYIGIAATFVITLAVIYRDSLDTNITALLTFWGVVIGGYMGFSTARDGWGKQ